MREPTFVPTTLELLVLELLEKNDTEMTVRELVEQSQRRASAPQTGQGEEGGELEAVGTQLKMNTAYKVLDRLWEHRLVRGVSSHRPITYAIGARGRRLLERRRAILEVEGVRERPPAGARNRVQIPVTMPPTLSTRERMILELLEHQQVPRSTGWVAEHATPWIRAGSVATMLRRLASRGYLDVWRDARSSRTRNLYELNAEGRRRLASARGGERRRSSRET